jgi:uncharacterized protein YegP (UPF0339 family)
MTRLHAVRLFALAAGLFALAGLSRAQDPPKLKFELYADKAGEFRWRLKAANGEVLATPGQGYKAKADAKNGIEAVKRAGVDDKMKFELYEDAKKEHRWKLKSGNGQVVAVSSQGYKAKADAEKATASIKAGGPKAEVVEVKE